MDTAQKMCSLAADDKVEELRAWHLAGVDFSAGDYDRRTALHVVSGTQSISETASKLLLHSPRMSVIGEKISDTLFL